MGLEEWGPRNGGEGNGGRHGSVVHDALPFAHVGQAPGTFRTTVGKTTSPGGRVSRKYHSVEPRRASDAICLRVAGELNQGLGRSIPCAETRLVGPDTGLFGGASVGRDKGGDTQ